MNTKSRTLIVMTCAAFIIAGAYAQPPEQGGGFGQGPQAGGQHRGGPGGGPQDDFGPGRRMREGREGRGPGGPREGRGPGGPMGGFDDQETREVIETVMMVRMSKELNLDDEQTVLLIRRIEGFKEKQQELKKKHQELAEELREAVKSDASDSAIRAKLDALINHDRTMTAAKFDLFDEVTQGLDDTQRAKMYVFMQDFEDHMRRLIHRAQQRGRGGMQQGGPPDGMQRGGPPDGDGFGRGGFEGRRPMQGQDDFGPGRRQRDGRDGRRSGGPDQQGFRPQRGPGGAPPQGGPPPGDGPR